MVSSDILPAVRESIYSTIVETGAAPAAESVAQALKRPAPLVDDAYRELADGHVIVLERGATTIWSAPPFSAVPTPFLVRSGPSSWYAPCAWDAFGIPAALHRDARIDARCAWSGDAIPCGVEDGAAYGDGVIHLLVPAARFWDDIFYT